MSFTLLSHLVPALVVLERFLCVDLDIAVLLVSRRPTQFYLLEPAVGTANRIRLYCVSDVLVDSSIPPPDPVGIRVI